MTELVFFAVKRECPKSIAGVRLERRPESDSDDKVVSDFSAMPSAIRLGARVF